MIMTTPFLFPSPSSSPSNHTASGSNSSTSTSSLFSSSRTVKPPPISCTPSLRRSSNQTQPSISTILNPDANSNSAGRRLELEERSDWDARTGRADGLAMRLDRNSPALPFLRDGGRDRWGNRWGIENHVLSPVISELTEPTHTSVSSPISTGSISTHFSLSSSTCPFQPQEQLEHQQHHHQQQQQQQQQQVSSNPMMPGDYPGHSNHLHQVNSLSPSNRTTTSYSITSTRSHQSPTRLTNHSGSTAYQSTRSRADSLQSQSITTNPSPNQPSFVSAKDHQDPSPSPDNQFPSSSLISKADSHHPQSSSIENHPVHTHHQHAISLLKRKKIKTHISNRQRDLDVANRQITKRIEKEKRDQLIRSRDEIVSQLMENPNDAKLVRDLGKLYLRFNEPDQNETRQGNVSRRIGKSGASPRSEPSLKLAIHYLEQSIQIDTRDPLTWLFLGRAWSLLLVYPTENENEREQRLSNSSLAFRKAIHISSNLTGSNLQNIRQTNRFRLAYAEHLEGLHKYQEAASVLQDALGIDETDVECWWELGRMMELWALDQEAQSPTTKLERVERMRRACEAFKKATELEPDDMILRQGNLDGEKALKKLTTELQAEEEFRAKSLKAEEEIRLAAERMRGLNLSPVGTNKATEITSAKPQTTSTNLSSVSALKKLVSDLREIPEFGQKARPAPPVVQDKTQSIEESAVKTDDQICTTQVESVISSSPAPSSGANHTRVLTGEIDGSSLTRNSALPHVIQENLKAPEPSQLLPPISKTIQPKNPARYQTGSTSVDSSPQEDLSPPSTQSQDDAKMMLMNLRTGSIEPPLEFDHQDEQPSMTQVITNQSHDSQLYSYQPPSPSALPTSMMQSLSARLGTPKAHLISSPKSSVSSNSRSCSNGSQKAREWHQRKMNSQHDPAEPGLIANQPPSTTSHSPAPLSQSPAHDRPRSLKAQLTEIIRGSSLSLRDSDSNHQSQQAPSLSASSETHHSPSSGDHNLSCDQPENRPPSGEYHQSEDRSSHSPSSYPHRHHSLHSQTDFHHHQPHVSVLKKPTIGNSNGIFSPLSKELTVDLDPPGSSPPPPDIPPRPASLCVQSPRPPSLPHPHHPSSSILYNKDHQSSSHFIDHNPHHSVPAPPHQDGTMYATQSINGHHQSVVGSIPQEDHHIRRPNSSCLSPRSPVRQSTTPRYTHSPTTTSTTKSSNCRLSSPPSVVHQTAFIQGDQSNMACNYALIDAHLQSILEIDLKRKQELKEIKRQIRKTDEWAESRRRTVIEEIRRVCTPVSSGSVSVHPHTPHQSGSSHSHSRSLSRGQPTEAIMSPKPVDNQRLNECQTKQNGMDDSARLKRTPEYPVNLGESVGRRKAVPRTPVVAAPVLHPTKRSSSTPPETSYTPPHHQHRLGNQDQMNPKLQAAVYSDPSMTLGNFRQEHVLPNRALHSASVLPSHHHPSPPPPPPHHYHQHRQHQNSYHPLSPHPSQPKKHNHPPSHNPDGQHQQQPIVADQLSTEFDKLGPAGFAINGITSIIQLLHQQHQLPPP